MPPKRPLPALRLFYALIGIDGDKSTLSRVLGLVKICWAC